MLTSLFVLMDCVRFLDFDYVKENECVQSRLTLVSYLDGVTCDHQCRFIWKTSLIIYMIDGVLDLDNKLQVHLEVRGNCKSPIPCGSCDCPSTVKIFGCQTVDLCRRRDLFTLYLWFMT